MLLIALQIKRMLTNLGNSDKLKSLVKCLETLHHSSIYLVLTIYI